MHMLTRSLKGITGGWVYIWYSITSPIPLSGPTVSNIHYTWCSLRYIYDILTPLWYCWPGLSHGAQAGGWGVSGVYSPHPSLLIYIANGRNGIQWMHLKEHSFWLRTWYPYTWELGYSCKDTQLSMLYVISLLCWVVIAQGEQRKSL